jgi:DNA-binding NarL/FixJ family response regulator
MPLVTVLIEDSSTIRESLIPALAEVANAKVIAVAETAVEGIAALRAHADSWRLAVVDMFLRSGNGLEVLRAFGTRRADQRMLVLTNYATAEIRKKALDAGADAVFDKSTEVDAFFELCRTYSTE